MSRGDGKRPPPGGNGQKKLVGPQWDTIPQEGPVIPCPFHHHEVPHPHGAPPCFRDPVNLTSPRLMNMGNLIYWQAFFTMKADAGFEALGEALQDRETRLVALEEGMAALRKDILGG